jgi:hypothetical protein
VIMRAAVLPFFALTACVAAENVVDVPAFSDTSAIADRGPVDEGNGLVGLVSGGITDTGSQRWQYELLDCATGTYVIISTYDEVGVSEQRALRLPRYVDEQRQAGATSSLETFFKVSSRAGMNPFQNQFHKGLADEGGCNEHYPNTAREWPVMSDADRAERERQRALIASVVGVTATTP